MLSCLRLELAPAGYNIKFKINFITLLLTYMYARSSVVIIHCMRRKYVVFYKSAS